MRDEFVRVLAYDTLHSALSRRGLSAEAAMEQFDRYSEWMPTPATARVRCTDPDDQVFIDLAVAHGATLVSKDRAVVRLARVLMPHGVHVVRVASVTSFLS
jgi:predicted nucleic acid-binding protein